MNSVDLNAHARRLLEAYGPKASAIAAQKARAFEDAGNQKDAETWRRLEAVIAGIRSNAVS